MVKQRGQDGKEQPWPVQPESAGAVDCAVGGSQHPFRTANAYDKALGLKAAKKPNPFLLTSGLAAFRQQHFGVKPQRSWQEAVVRYLASKANLRSFRDYQRICRMLAPYLCSMMLAKINGDVIWAITQTEAVAATAARRFRSPSTCCSTTPRGAIFGGGGGGGGGDGGTTINALPNGLGGGRGGGGRGNSGGAHGSHGTGTHDRGATGLMAGRQARAAAAQEATTARRTRPAKAATVGAGRVRRKTAPTAARPDRTVAADQAEVRAMRSRSTVTP